jgi:hypothetical protein
LKCSSMASIAVQTALRKANSNQRDVRPGSSQEYQGVRFPVRASPRDRCQTRY